MMAMTTSNSTSVNPRDSGRNLRMAWALQPRNRTNSAWHQPRFTAPSRDCRRSAKGKQRKRLAGRRLVAPAAAAKTWFAASREHLLSHFGELFLAQLAVFVGIELQRAIG